MAGDATLVDLLRRIAADRPGQVALRVDGGDTLTYGAWERRSGALARGLRRWGVDAGDRVGVCFDGTRWTEHVVACLAVQKAAGIAVPLQAGLSGIEARRQLAAADAAALLGPADLGLAGAGVPAPGIAELEADGADDPLAATPGPDDAGELVCTAPPLARPRTRLRSHAELAAGPWRQAGVGDAAAPVVHAFPPGSVAGQDAMAAALHPSPVPVLALPAFEAERLCALLADEPGPGCALHPAAAHGLLDSGALARHDAGGVRLLVLAGGRVTPALLLRLEAAFPRAEVLGVDVLGTPGPRPAHAARTVFRHDRTRPGALGRPVGAPTVDVVDEGGEPVGAGGVGGVRVDGERTPATGFLDAGGCLYLASGHHDVIRGPHATVCRAELEEALRAHPAVADAAVLGVPDDRDAARLAAAVVAPPATTDPAGVEADLRTLVADRLGPEKLPDLVTVVDDLPRNDAGLVLRRALRHRLGLAPAPGEAGHPADAGESAGEPAGVGEATEAGPRGPVEEAVAAAWRRVLGRRDVGVHDDFFELGGGWGDAAAVTSLLEDATGAAVTPAALAEAPTVAGLAAAVERARAAGAADSADETVAPVAGSQQGMLWHEHFAPGCQNLPGLARRYRGPLDVGALQRALDEIVRRHGALRTTFALHAGRLRQRVAPHRGLSLPVQDLTHLAAGEQDAEVERLAADAGHRPFDLVTEDLFAPTLLRLADDDHVLLLRTHHSVFDDWSVGVFRGELATLYTAFTRGEDSPLAEPPVQFADFSRNRAARLAGPAGARELSFWRRELAGAPLVSQLPVDDPDRPEGSPQPSAEPVSVALPAGVHEQLRSLAQRERATVFMATLAAFAALVQRYTGQDDLVLATVVANRNRTEHEGLIGCFTKKVPLRLRLTGDPTFTEALSRTREALLGALTRQDLPYEDVVQATLGPPAAAHGLVPHLALMFQGVTSPQELSLPGVDSEGLRTSERARRTHFMAGDEQAEADDEQAALGGGAAAAPWGAGLYLNTFLILSVDESDEGLTCSARGAFHAAAARGVMDSYRVLLTDAAADPARRVSALSVLDEDGRAEALARGRGPAVTGSAAAPLDVLATQVAQRPDAVAVRSPSEDVTFAALDARADRLARRLRVTGVEPGQAVGLALPAGVDAVVATLAGWKAGAAVTGLDPRDDPARLGRILDDAAVAVVVADQAADTLPRHATVVAADADAGGPPPPTAPAGGPDHAAVCFHGSGRSAVSPGVVLDHRAVGNLLAGLRSAVHRWPDGTGSPRRVCLSSPPTQDGFLRQLVAVVDGHTLVVPERTLPADPDGVVGLLAAGELDLVDCAPAEAAALVDADLGRRAGQRTREAGDAVVAVAGRGAVSPELWASLRRLDRVRAHVVYGPPECAFAATARTVDEPPGRTTAGRPLVNVAAHVLDSGRHPVPARAVGELHLGGTSLGRHAGPDPTRRDPADTSPEDGDGRLWPTGQLARRLPGGDVELLGAADADTDLRGFRVDPSRVAAALADSPGVGDAGAAVERDEHAEPRLVASVVTDGREPVSLAGLRRALWARLPGYAWPSRLRPADEHDGTGHPEPYATLLAALWAETLGVDTVEGTENYWQAFSFLETLARGREAGVSPAGEHVTSNRTVAALATALAARRHPRVH